MSRKKAYPVRYNRREFGLYCIAEKKTMKFGHFDDIAREYVITRPDTPLPWINYLGCEAYFGLISNTAGGYSFYKDARLRRLTQTRRGTTL